MYELLYVFLGWLAGLLSPRIIDNIKESYDRKKLAAAIRLEAEDLQIRIACNSFYLVQSGYGELTRQYLNWLRPKFSNYEGDEPTQSALELIDKLLNIPEDQYQNFGNCQEDGRGVSLKLGNCSLIDSSLNSLIVFPIEYQRNIHEFRNQFSYLNQAIKKYNEMHTMTFDSSMSPENHQILRKDLIERNNDINKKCQRVVDKLQKIIDYDI